MTSNASIGLRLWEIGQFKDIAENQAAFETLQTNDYGTNYHTKWHPVRRATQTGKKKLFPASSPTDRKP
jgi:hypothetical protein